VTEVDSLSPYKGLTPFEDSDLDVLFFFGRERERELVEANLMASRLTVLYGDTGVGKTSILRAGVAHNLRSVARKNLEQRREPGLAVAVFDSWRDDPAVALRRAVAEAVTGALGGSLQAPDEEASLIDALRMWQQVLDGDVYVILDQAEEYFLYHSGEEGAGSFAVDFPAVVNSSDLRVHFLIAIREDALAKLDVFRAKIPNVLGNYLRLEHLDPQAARTAIVEPVAQYNRLVAETEAVEIEAELVDAVLEQVVAGKVDVGQSGRGAVEGGDGVVRIETPYLQLVMQRLWDEERSTDALRLRLETLCRLGGAEHIVHDHVDGALTGLTPAEKDVAARMFDHLVTPSGTKIAHEAGDLARYARTPEGDIIPVLTKLGNERILRSVAGNGTRGSRYELFHDVLAEPVLAWKAAHETHTELDRQKAESEKRHRRLLRLVAVAAVALLVMAGVTVFALTQRSEARSQARLARARELAARAIAQLDIDPQRSLALAVDAASLRHIPQAEDVLRTALIQSKERAVLPSHGPVNTAVFSPDGSRVLTASNDGAARIWPLGERRAVRVLRHAGPVHTAVFSRDGGLVVTASQDGTARIWQTRSGRQLRTLPQHGPVTAASFSPDGTLVLTAGGGKARLWQTATGRMLHALRHPGPVLGGSFSRDSRLVVTIGSDRDGSNMRARIFDVGSGRLLRELRATGVTAATFSPDGLRVVTGSEDHTAAIWRIRDGKRVRLFAEQQSGVTDALFGPNGRLAVTTSSDGATRVWDARAGRRPVATLLGHVNAVNSASFSNDGKFLITASADGTARVWEAANGRPEAVLRGHTDSVAEGAFSLDGRAVVTASADGTARVWDPGTASELRVFTRARAPVRVASFSSDNRFVLTAGDDGTARILTVGGGLIRVLRHPGPVASATFGPNGRLVFTAGADRVLRVWKAATGALLHDVRGVSAGPLAVSPDGQRLAAPAENGIIRIWSTATFSPVMELRKGAPFTAVSFSPDGRTIATAGEEGIARIWDARTGALLRTLEGHKAALTGAQFSPNGKLLVTSSRDHDVRIWDVATGMPSELLRGHFGPVFGASFSPDSRWVVSAGPSTAGLWQVSDGRLLLYLRHHTEPLTSASFSPDGRRILTSSRDGTVQSYRCELCGGIDDLLVLANTRLAGLARPLTAAERQRYLPDDAAAPGAADS
jgi:WD40 repeat protein